MESEYSFSGRFLISQLLRDNSWEESASGECVESISSPVDADLMNEREGAGV